MNTKVIHSALCSQIRQFSTSTQSSQRQVKKRYFEYAPKWMLHRRSRMHTRDMNRILPRWAYVLSGRHTNQTIIGGSNRLAERMAVHTVQPQGRHIRGKFRQVRTMVPEFIVPDISTCDLRPYVPYNAEEIVQGEFTYKDLFNACYAPKLVQAIKEGKVDVDDRGEVVLKDESIMNLGQEKEEETEKESKEENREKMKKTIEEKKIEEKKKIEEMKMKEKEKKQESPDVNPWE